MSEKWISGTAQTSEKFVRGITQRYVSEIWVRGVEPKGSVMWVTERRVRKMDQ